MVFYYNKSLGSQSQKILFIYYLHNLKQSIYFTELLQFVFER